MSESFTFEGDEVTNFTAQLPSATLEAPEAYQRGTLLTLSVQVRVKSVRLEEGRDGELTRKHVLALEECNVTDVLTPAERKALIEAALATEAEEADPGEYTVTEVPEASDFVTFAHGEEPVSDYEAPASVDDDDPEHAWMDDDDEPGVHADIAALIG
jgi:hypothetical protein